MTLRLRNTLTRSVEPVEPLEPGPGPDVHLRADGLPLRPRRQPAQLPAGRPHPPRPAVPRPGRAARQEHHRRRPPARRAASIAARTGCSSRPGSSRRRRAEIADAYEAAFHADEAAVNILPAHVFPRATEHIPEMLELAEALEDAGHAYVSPRRQRVLRGRVVPRLRPPVRQHARRPAAGHRGEVEPDKRDPADFALWKAAGEGRRAEVADAALGRGLPGLAPGVLGDGPALPGRPVRHPHRRHRQRLPPPRGRDRPVGADRRRATGDAVGPRRAPAHGGPEDGQVGGQLPAGHGARRAGHRPARLPLPRPDLALRAQARLLGRLDRGGGRGPRVAARAAGGARSAARRRPVGSAIDRRGRNRPAIARPARPSGHEDRGRRPRARDPGARCPPPARRSTTGSSRRSTTTSTCRPRWPSSARSLRADLPADERRWLVLDADAVLGLDLHRVWDTVAVGEPAAIPADVAALVADRSEARARRDFAAADTARDTLTAMGWEVIDGADGPEVRRRRE